ncbi:ORF4' protein [Pebjah virus]|uniref:ORF4' protein n=1 Tax=Pebjah virus TaxID=1658615 RepID=A0A0G2UH81_9NIDO|nr:ORF4' protein [Pebjah virus]AKI29945.1 ORF4' protein [Pebjah virus]AKI29960.1 ORF4' protein [Pebjah virus]
MGYLFPRVTQAFYLLCLVACCCGTLVCIPCNAHNTTHIDSWVRQTFSNTFDSKGQPHNAPGASIYAYGTTCSDKLLVGAVYSLEEQVTGGDSLGPALSILALANCLAVAAEQATAGVDVYFAQSGNLTAMCYNHTHVALSYLNLYHSTAPFSPFVIRWATVCCGILAVLRALFHG